MNPFLAFSYRLAMLVITSAVFQTGHVIGQQGGAPPLGQLGRLTGPGYKIPGNKYLTSPSFRAGLAAGLSLPRQPGSQAITGDILDSVSKTIFSDEMLFGRLFEKLGGEFFPGGSGTNREISGIRLSPGFLYGIKADGFIGKGFRAGLSYSRHHHSLTAEFPVTVFVPGQEMPDSVTGKVSSGITFNRISLEAKYFMTKSRLQPYAGLSISWQWQKAGETNVQLAGEEFVIPYEMPEDNYAGCSVGAGAVYAFTRHVSTALNIEYFFAFSDKDRIPGDGPDLSLQIFWNFP